MQEVAFGGMIARLSEDLNDDSSYLEEKAEEPVGVLAERARGNAYDLREFLWHVSCVIQEKEARKKEEA